MGTNIDCDDVSHCIECLFLRGNDLFVCELPDTIRDRKHWICDRSCDHPRHDGVGAGGIDN